MLSRIKFSLLSLTAIFLLTILYFIGIENDLQERPKYHRIDEPSRQPQISEVQQVQLKESEKPSQAEPKYVYFMSINDKRKLNSKYIYRGHAFFTKSKPN